MTQSSTLEETATRPARGWKDLRVAGPLFVALVLLGIFVPRPVYVSGIWAIGFLWLGPPADHHSVKSVGWCSTLLVLVPIALFLLGLYGLRQRQALAALRGSCAIFLAVACIDLPLSALLGGMLGTEASFYLQSAVAISVISINLFFVCALRQLELGQTEISRGCVKAGLPAMAMAIWSLLQIPLVVAQAAYLAGDRPFCIANANGANPGYAPVGSMFDLRGTNFYTDLTGYKSTSRWYFHGVLIVRDATAGDKYWNWSISRMSFEPRSNSGQYIKDWRKACTPEPNALSRLRWY